MNGYCSSCGAPISHGYKFCTMCSGNPNQGSDDYYRQEWERREREAEYRVIPCEACGSEGRVLTSDGGPYDKDHGPCPYCDGTGSELIEVQPITIEDLSLTTP